MPGFGSGRVSSWQAAAWIAELSSISLWFGLSDSDPNVSDPATAELIGASYSRMIAGFTAIGPYALLQPADIVFSGLPMDAVVAAVCVWDAKIGGNMRAAFVLSTPLNFPAGGDYTIPGGQFEIGLDVPVL